MEIYKKNFVKQVLILLSAFNDIKLWTYNDVFDVYVTVYL